MVSGARGNQRSLFPLPCTRICDSENSRFSRSRASTSQERRPSRSIKPTMAKSREIGRASRRESDWSSDVCSSDLPARAFAIRKTADSPGQERALRKSVGRREASSRQWPNRVRSEERRVGKVTGVQTCALPISLHAHLRFGKQQILPVKSEHFARA